MLKATSLKDLRVEEPELGHTVVADVISLRIKGERTGVAQRSVPFLIAQANFIELVMSHVVGEVECAEAGLPRGQAHEQRVKTVGNIQCTLVMGMRASYTCVFVDVVALEFNI